VICQATPNQAERFRSAIGRRMGLRFDDVRLGFLEEVLQRRLKKLGCDSDAYLWDLENRGLKDELTDLARELTVGETYFFRNVEQFRALAEIVLPERVRAQQSSRTLRLLSAGCASGEEAYTMAIIAREAVADPSWQITIQAVDINPLAIEKARRARYSTWALRETPTESRSRWFRREGSEIVLDDSVRRAVTFEAGNLADADAGLWRPAFYDVIFCRNALMYFEPEQMRAAIERIASSLAPGGFLFLGHAETLRGVSERFHLRHTHDTFYHQLKADGEDAEATIGPFIPRQDFNAASRLSADSSWYNDICLATERVAALMSRTDAVEETPQRASAFDMAPVIDLFRKEQFAEALDLVRTGTSAAGSDRDLLLFESVLLIQGGQIAAAEDVAHRLLSLDSQNAGAHYVLALCFEHAAQNHRAIAHHKAAAALNATFAMPRLHLGLLARRAGDRQTAQREFAQALSLLEREDARQLLLFGGGFNREALMVLCSSALAECGKKP
jgi:chemotaxis protein methyltransferase CheR